MPYLPEHSSGKELPSLAAVAVDAVVAAVVQLVAGAGAID